MMIVCQSQAGDFRAGRSCAPGPQRSGRGLGAAPAPGGPGTSPQLRCRQPRARERAGRHRVCSARLGGWFGGRKLCSEGQTLFRHPSVWGKTQELACGSRCQADAWGAAGRSLCEGSGRQIVPGALLCPAAPGSPRLRGPRRGCPGLNSEADRQGLPGLVSDNVRGGGTRCPQLSLSCVCFTSRGDTAAALVNRCCRAVEVGGMVPWAWGCGGRPAGSGGAPGLRSRLPGSTVGM